MSSQNFTVSRRALSTAFTKPAGSSRSMAFVMASIASFCFFAQRAAGEVELLSASPLLAPLLAALSAPGDVLLEGDHELALLLHLGLGLLQRRVDGEEAAHRLEAGHVGHLQRLLP